MLANLKTLKLGIYADSEVGMQSEMKESDTLNTK